jgi:hypothetical protein
VEAVIRYLEQPQHFVYVCHDSVTLDDETAHVVEEWDAEQGRWVVTHTYAGRILRAPNDESAPPTS